MKNLFLVLFMTLILAPSTGGCSMLISKHDDTSTYTPLMAAADACDIEAAQKEFKRDASQINMLDTDMNNATALHDAVEKNCIVVTQFLLDNHAKVNAAETDGTTPLHLAARDGDIEIIKVLLLAKAEINTLDAKGRTPLDRAQKRGRSQAVELLKQNGGHEGS